MNLVIHDLRNPSEAINQSLALAQDNTKINIDKIVSQIKEEIYTKMINKQSEI